MQGGRLLKGALVHQEFNLRIRSRLLQVRMLEMNAGKEDPK
jgi:hypothetical protein